MIPDLRMMRTFLAVMDHGSVAAAARARGYSPTAVSRQLSQMQSRLGKQLFVPSGRSIRPSEDAFDLMERAREFVAAADRFDAYAREVSLVRTSPSGAHAVAD